MWPVGAIEAHGPHLPLATDVLISEETARRSAEKLSARGRTVLILPAMSVTPASYAAAHAGTLSLSEGTAAAVVCDVARSLDSHAAESLVIVSAHVDPGHLRSLHAAAGAIGRVLKLRIVFPDLTRRPWVNRMPEEFRRGGAHAGFFETSCVMAARPDLVREEIRKSLPAVTVDLAARIRQGAKTFEECGGPDAYFGDPASAAAEAGVRFLEDLSDMVVEAAEGGSGETGGR